MLLTIVMFFFFKLFAVSFDNFFWYSINQGFKTKYILLELNVP